MSSIIIIGSGIAGLTAALEAAATHDVTLVTKARLADSSTRYAQGGIAVVSTPGDSISSHVEDTLAAGAGLSSLSATIALCSEGPDAVRELARRGAAFDRDDRTPPQSNDLDPLAGLAHRLEAAHRHARILHIGGDATGAGIAAALIEQVCGSGVRTREGETVIDLLLSEGRVTGVRLLGGEELRADAVILATGGAGQLYPHTTNPAVATGDGIALALRAGAIAADLEMYQFHPTALDAPDSFLVSEAVRGEGAVLLDTTGHRFMQAVHPDAELAPRDVVARGIVAQMARQPGTPVRLDATRLGADFLARRFPTIDAACRGRGLDWSAAPLPVAPAAHYFMGGVRTDTHGRTSLRGLYAIGEVACTGLHGANRLASNSLLEGAVYAARCIRAIEDQPPPSTPDAAWSPPIALPTGGRGPDRDATRDDLQQLMWQHAGLVRDKAGLTAAVTALACWRMPEVTDAKSAEDANLLLVARAVVASALARRESRGAHYRSDAPYPADGPVAHSTIQVVPGA